MRTNEIKKGMRVKMNKGWIGTMFDNMRGNTRMVEVEGDFTEIGSVYAHDIAKVWVDNTWVNVEHTPSQLKMKKQVEAFFQK